MRPNAPSSDHLVRCDADLCRYVFRTLIYEYQGKYRGGHIVLSGNATITINAAGYLPEMHYVTVSSFSRYFQFFSVPRDGQTRAGVKGARDCFFHFI
jgi:hypothetical protein